jgi:uncharacterized protein
VLPKASAAKALILPGWQDSGALHWQSRWEALYGYTRVQQHDWMRPLRGDWIARLEDVVLSVPAGQPISLVAHSLGCVLVAAWASVSRNAHRVTSALLVAPGDVEREDLRQMLPSWAPIPRQKLPFARCLLVGSRNDPYCSLDRAQGLAQSWGAEFSDAGERGHLNADSGLESWPEGHRALLKLQQSIN